MKKIVAILTLIVALLVAPQAQATSYSYDNVNYRFNLLPTDIGTFIFIKVKTVSALTVSPFVLKQRFDGNISNTSQFVSHSDSFDVTGSKLFWLGGLTSATTYYFYPFFTSSSISHAGTVLPFKTDSVGKTSGSYELIEKSFSNGTLTFTFQAPKTDTRTLFVTAIPRSAFTSVSAPINTYDYRYVSVGKIPASGVGESTITGLTAGKDYILVMQPDGVGISEPLTAAHITTGAPTLSARDLKFTSSGSTEKVTGKIDTTSVDFPEDYNAFIEYRPTSDAPAFNTDLTKEPVGAGYWASVSLDSNTINGINHDGSYYWTLLNIGTGDYWFRETFWNKDKTAVIGTPIVQKFNGDKGLIITGSATDQSNFENQSYRLLAPLPGLSVLLDPALCLTQQVQTGTGQICDVNDFLNYIFRLLIGVAAVILVVRIIIEGFAYATTDIPGVKMSAKGKLWQGVWGLLLALSAWLILNTINPQLVQNDITIPSLTVSVDDTTFISDAAFQKIVGRKITPKPQLLAIVKQVATEKNIDACVIESIIQQESPSWNEAEIGCDENAARVGVSARSAFISSGITLTGKLLRSDASITDGSVRNDNFTPGKGTSSCHFDETKPGYNLDWRFSKGFGLSQNTYNPKEVNHLSDSQYLAATKQGGSLWNTRSNPPSDSIMATLLADPKQQVEYLVDHFRERSSLKKCGNDLQCSFASYNGSGPSATLYGQQVYATYQRCKSSGGL